jgi:EmrB/QacA subfamily drug resistance transporter
MSTKTLPAPLLTADENSLSRAKWLGFTVLTVAAVMDLLDATITQTAAPAIRHDLSGNYAGLEWITAAYTLAMATMLMVGSRLGDMFGRRRVLLVSMAGFVGASMLCAVAPTMSSLIAARVMQGAIGAMMIPQGFGLIRELFGDEGQQQAFGVFGPVMGLAAVAGPLVGGGLVDLNVLGSGWRAIFFANVPLGLGAILLGLRYLPRNGATHADSRLDWVSVGLVVAGAFGLVYPLIEGRQQSWPAWSFVMLAAGIVLLTAACRRQALRVRNGRAPLFEPDLLRRRQFVSGLAVVIGFMGALGGTIVALNVMFQTGLGFSPLSCGVATVAIPVVAIVGSITSSVLLAKIGRTTMHAGLAIMALGLAVAVLVLHHVGGKLSAWDLTGPLAVTGFGMGMVFVPMFDVILAGVEPRQIGSASGLLESTQQLGMSLGIAIVGTELFDRISDGHGRGIFVDAAASALIVAIGFLIAAFVAVSWLPKWSRS